MTDTVDISAAERAELRNAAGRLLGNLDRERRVDWVAVRDLGWTAVGVPVEMGGVGYGERARQVIAEAAGESLAGGQLWATLGLGLPMALSLGETSTVKSIVEGAQATIAWCGHGSERFSSALANPPFRVRDDIVRGVAHAVPNAHSSDHIFVPVAAEGPTAELWLLPRSSLTVEETSSAYLDAPNEVATIRVDGPGVRVARGEQAHQAWHSTRIKASLWLASEALGVASAALRLAVAHAKEREQFGRRIGSYQAVAHPLADLYGDVEMARSAVGWATESFDLARSDVHEAALAASALAIQTGITAAETSIQVLGGMGMTWESPAHWYLKRAMAISAFDGGPRHAYDELGDRLFGPEGILR